MYVEYYLYHSCSEKLDTLFASLTKDLMDPDNSMERNFELMLELKTATEKYFHLKKLFWKVCLDAGTYHVVPCDGMSGLCLLYV